MSLEEEIAEQIDSLSCKLLELAQTSEILLSKQGKKLNLLHAKLIVTSEILDDLEARISTLENRDV